MNKNEFIIEAALRMVGNYQGVTMEDIAGMARDLADELYPEAPIHHGKPDTDSIEVLLKEVAKVEEQHVEELKKDYRYRQKGGLDIRLRNAIASCSIETVGDLLKYGRRELQKTRNVGPHTVECVDEALLNLYNITTW